MEKVCFALPLAALQKQPADQPARLAIYVHGGLNSKEDSHTRIRKMAPYFRENDIHPLFFTWKTGVLDGIGDMLQDALRNIFRCLPEMRYDGIVDKIKEAIAEARGRTDTAACANLLVKPLWPK
ncbi:MAG: hypothetical protein ACOY32_15900 [Thermodesulfobacteriota bacterium]